MGDAYSSPAAAPRSVSPIFLGGAARSGTTLLSALLSTSQACNAFSPEYHYLATVVAALQPGELSYESSAAHFNRSREAMRARHMRFVGELLEEAHDVAGRPERLVIKHCMLTPFFGLLAEHFPQARFVALVRDPRDIAASQQRAALRMGLSAISERQYERFTGNFKLYYSALARDAEALADRMFVLRYEALAEGEIQPLADFLGLELRPEQLWRRAGFDIHSFQADPLYSEGWGKAVNADSVGAWRREITDELAARVVGDCAPVMVDFLRRTEAAQAGKILAPA